MLEKARKYRAEHEEMQRKLQDPEISADHRQVASMGKRLKELKPIVDHINEYESCEKVIATSRAITEPELREIALEEEKIAKERQKDIEKELEELFIPKDPMADRNCILEVRAGAGGEEAALFAAELLRMYLRFAERKEWKTELLSKTDAEVGGIKEAIIHVTGVGAYGTLKFEGGVHRVQRIPETEAKGRIHTSTATVAVLPEAETVDIEIRPEDIQVDTFRAGGAGGQHVNKTESAIRITHKPTGVVVTCQSERSQIQNRAKGMEFLRTKLLAKKEEDEAKTQGSLRSQQVKSGDRSDKVRTYNFPQDRVTDHRLEQSFHNLPGIMEGALDPIITVLTHWSKEQRKEI